MRDKRLRQRQYERKMYRINNYDKKQKNQDKGRMTKGGRYAGYCLMIMSDIKSEKLKSKSEVRSNNLKFDSLRLENRSSDPVFLQARTRFPVPT